MQLLHFSRNLSLSLIFCIHFSPFDSSIYHIYCYLSHNALLLAYQTPSLYCLSLSSFSTLSELFQLNLSLLTSLPLSLSHPLTSFSHHCLSFLPFLIYP